MATPIRKILLSTLALALILGLLASCSNLAYYGQALSGGAKILAKRRPIEKVIADAETSAEIREKLTLVLEIREFASAALALPDNKSYRTYSDLGRPYAVWNVVAAPDLSVRPLTWCFPVAGCVSYRGYFSQKRAERFAAGLRERSYDVDVGGVAAYSTLGWFKDPILSSFLRREEPDLAGLLFHELAHQVAYAKGDTAFNESFATAVELEGVDRWLASRGDPDAGERYREAQRRQDQFVALVLKYRDRLEEVFAGDSDEATRRAEKERVYADLRDAYELLKIEEWGGYDRYDAWFGEGLNNARLATVGAYHDLVPGFEALLEEHDGDMGAFYAAVVELVKLDRKARRARLE